MKTEELDSIDSILREGLSPMEYQWVRSSLKVIMRTRKALGTADQNTGSAWLMVRALQQVAAMLAGKDALSLVYGKNPPPDASRDVHLNALWQRLWVAEEFFTDVEDRAAQSSISALTDEVLAVANGDGPQLLARTISEAKGAGLKRYRLAFHKLKALEWEKYLHELDVEAGEIQSKLGGAFGNTPWPTIRGWRKEVESVFGAFQIAYQLELISHNAHPHFLERGTLSEDIARMEADGAAYKLARGATPGTRPRRKTARSPARKNG